MVLDHCETATHVFPQDAEHQELALLSCSTATVQNVEITWYETDIQPTQATPGDVEVSKMLPVDPGTSCKPNFQAYITIQVIISSYFKKIYYTQILAWKTKTVFNLGGYSNKNFA